MSLEAQFEPMEVIGRGSFGLIRKVRRLSDGKILARKEISYRTMNIKEKNQLMAEFRILKSLVHPNIVQYYYHDHVMAEHAVHLYMEYCDGGDLGGVIRTCKSTGEYVPEALVWSVFTQLTLALFRCHYNSDPPPAADLFSPCSNISAGIISSTVNIMNVTDPLFAPPSPSTVILHRDIKPDNVFLDKFNTVKLGDFGLAKILDQEHFMSNTYVGTPYYMSPEVLNDQPFTPQSDIWSLGCVIYELCAKHPPFQAKTHMQLSQKIREGTYPPLPGNYSQTLSKTIAACLAQNSRLRPTTAALLHLDPMNLCRKERAIEEVRRELETAQNNMTVEMRQREQMLIAKEEELKSKEQILMAQEEQFLRDRETVVNQAQMLQQEQEQQQLKMLQINEEFNLKVEQEVQQRLTLLQMEYASGYDMNSSNDSGSNGDRSTKKVTNFLHSPTDVIMTSSASSSSSTSSNGSIGAASTTTVSTVATSATSATSSSIPRSGGVKGPRKIRDASTPFSLGSRPPSAMSGVLRSGGPRSQRSISNSSSGSAQSGTGGPDADEEPDSTLQESPRDMHYHKTLLEHRGSSQSLTPSRSAGVVSPPPVRKARSAAPMNAVNMNAAGLRTSPPRRDYSDEGNGNHATAGRNRNSSSNMNDNYYSPASMSPPILGDAFTQQPKSNHYEQHYNRYRSGTNENIESSGLRSPFTPPGSSYHQPIVLEDDVSVDDGGSDSIASSDVLSTAQKLQNQLNISPTRPPALYHHQQHQQQQQQQQQPPQVSNPGPNKVVKKPFSPLRGLPRDRQPPHYQAIYEASSRSQSPAARPFTSPLVRPAMRPAPPPPQASSAAIGSNFSSASAPTPTLQMLGSKAALATAKNSGAENVYGTYPTYSSNNGGTYGGSPGGSPVPPQHYSSPTGAGAQRRALLPNMNLQNYRSGGNKGDDRS